MSCLLGQHEMWMSHPGCEILPANSHSHDIAALHGHPVW
jgi:hypothetical protein